MTALFYGTVVGLSLGLTGGGGSIFAVPLLVYGLHFEFRQAVAISLAIVGTTALFGALMQARRRHVLWRAGGLLGLGGVVSAPIGAAIGQQTPEGISLFLFATLMTVVGIQMIRGPGNLPLSALACQRDPQGKPRFSPLCAAKLFTAGLITGILSGIFGVGGGFLLVPALLVVTAIPIEQAMATSLVAICLISASGFAAQLNSVVAASLTPALLFLGGSAVGMTVGISIKNQLPSAVLRRLFGSAVLITAGFIVYSSLLKF